MGTLNDLIIGNVKGVIFLQGVTFLRVVVATFRGNDTFSIDEK